MDAYTAPSLFQPHRARQALRDAHAGVIPPLLGFYFGMSSIPVARVVATLGFDTVWIDWEHTSCNVETMTTMVHDIMFMSQGRTIPFVRVPGHDHAAIGYALDAGASIVVPQVDTVAQAQHVVSAAKFGAKINGTRSAPPFRLVPGITDGVHDEALGSLFENLNAQAAVMIQIESLEGIQNLDAILTAVPDIDACWLGTLDARISMGLSGNGGMGGSEQEWQDAVKLYEDTMRKHNKPMAGFAMGDAETKKRMAKGKSYVTITADVMGLMGQLKELVDTRPLLPAENKTTE
ncbi:Pyruvate/Phosphoenolpyruvate kinase-like domain-containing protein [Geopyxis carbonaria]|nr:Pyruvate/Phosphoenolpyruvate kinase-like domain-containing protein [Geopyxis carbonaria]